MKNSFYVGRPMLHGVMFAVLLGLTAAKAGLAQDSGIPTTVSKASTVLDLSIPESPAFTALGVTPEKVTRPSNARALAAAILNGVDDKGILQNGVALDLAPYRLARGPRLTLADYRKSYAVRLLANTNFSLGTTHANTAADTSSRLALGFHTVLYNGGDTVTSKEISAAFTKVNDAYPLLPLVPTGNAEADAAANAAAAAAWDTAHGDALKQAYKKVAAKLEAKPIWTAAAAPLYVSETGSGKNLRWDGTSYWTSFSFGDPFNKNSASPSQFILHARMHDHERVADPNGAAGVMTTQNTSLLGVRYRFGSQDFRFSLEGAAQRSKLSGQSSKNSTLLSIVAEPHLAQSVWLALSINHDSSGKQGPIGFQTSLKYGLDR